ncbi:MAG: hypothetical protein LC808_05885, partial [Actinobacteria bacterium]|nr:hypothetical protein [Actinomycetota bacterium]
MDGSQTRAKRRGLYGSPERVRAMPARAGYTEQDVRESSAAGDLLVAERGAQLVGAVVLMPAGDVTRVATDGELEVSRLAVTLPARRAGVAR